MLCGKCQPFCLSLNVLTHCGLMTPYGDTDLGQHWLRYLACCLMAPSHYLNQCWLIFSKVQWHSVEGDLTKDSSPINQWNKLKKYLSRIVFKSNRGQCVNPEASDWCQHGGCIELDPSSCVLLWYKAWCNGVCQGDLLSLSLSLRNQGYINRKGDYTNSFVCDCSKPSALAIEMLQACTKPLIFD